MLSMEMHRLNSLLIVRDKGKTIKKKQDQPFFLPDSMLESIKIYPEESRIVFKTLRNHTVEYELPSDSDLVNPQPIIYLDQCHWSTLAKSYYSPNKINKNELLAAQRIRELAEQKKIILPMSFAHLMETTKWDNEKERYHLALTILKLSRGWVMREPLDIHRFEILSSFPNYSEKIEFSIFDTYLPLVTSKSNNNTQMHKMMPKDQYFLMEYSKEKSVCFDILLGSEPIPENDSLDWVESNQSFSNFLRDNPSKSKEMLRKRTDLRLLSDTYKEIIKVATKSNLTKNEFKAWLDQGLYNIVPDMPALGIWREAFHDKYSNVTTNWTKNDLIDLYYLTTATGYADLVIGEKQLTSIIDQGLKRLGRDKIIYKNLSTALPAIENLLHAS